MGTQTPSHQALIRHAVSQVLLLLTIAFSALILWAPQLVKLWRMHFDGVTVFDLIFYPLFLVAFLNGIFYAVRLVTWGRTLLEQSVTSALPMASRVEIPVPPSVSLRIMIFLRSKHTLSDVTGTICILSSSPPVVVTDKKMAGKQGTNAKVAILSVAPEHNPGRIILETALDWRPYTLNGKRDLVFDIIVRAKA